MTISWIEIIDRELLFNQKKYTACCPTEGAGIYKAQC